MNPGKAIQNKINGVKQNFADYKKLDSRDKKTYWKEFLLNNALYILLIVAIIYTYIQNSNFLSAASIVNIISLSAANLPIACGIAGCIVFGIVAGFCMGKYWLYPKYMGTSETIENTGYDLQDRSGELQDLNDQINSQDEQQ